ncbi:glycoside hydrolase family 6 protein [Cellulomonas sp. HZM]|uniref:glycoside hydrolase family 6 protein n=1 Tax=Cellulomonas sp. HZM TaxID=1454010 RepID=UPI000492F1E4|nr:glycoside hydrolase family 6 protein [Cellulomonas sp. HZM]
MRSAVRRRAITAGTSLAVVAGLCLATATSSSASTSPAPSAGSSSDRLYIDVAGTAAQAAASRTGQARADALAMANQPTARWFTKGTPAEVRASVDAYVSSAAADGSVPVLVAYDLPFRDCSQYSAGGAADTAAYAAWIDAMAAGIGHRKATVILEPDGLGIIPFNTDINGNAEWCQPAEADPATAVANRYAQFNHAVDSFKKNAATKVYLDAGNTNWLSVGDITDRLIKAGVQRADGWFVNSSNYGPTDQSAKYSSWISQCLDLVTNAGYQPAWCASQYYPASPGDFSTWALTDAAYATAYANANRTPDPATMKHGVIDTSRNGKGYWTPPAGKYSDAETWCNPPGRGLGDLPTLSTGDAYVDALLWIKIPGESDGKCYRGTGGPTDPERGIEDPDAGQWFDQLARELVQNAKVALPTPTCKVTQVTSKAWHGAFVSSVVVKNTGKTAIKGWKLTFAFSGTQKAKADLGAKITQGGQVVTATSVPLTSTIAPGRSIAFGYLGTGADAGLNPAVHVLNGQACA